VRERALEAAPRLDRRADDDELCSALGCHTGDLVAKQPGPSADDLAPRAHAVGRRHRSGRVQAVAQAAQLAVEIRVERQLPLDEERRDENDPRAAIGGQPAREVERVLRLLPLEERHDDRPVADRPRPARQPPRAAMDEPEVDPQSHLMTWYGTDARMTCFSKRSSRLT